MGEYRVETADGAEPTILAFFCTWCTYTAADQAGTARIKYPPNVRVVRVMCSGRVDPQFVVEAFAQGADGVLIGGCHPGDCHYVEGNYRALRRVTLLRRLLRQLGIPDERVRLEWISASESEKVARVIREMVQTMRGLQRLDLPGKRARWDEELLHEPGHRVAAAAPSDGR